jgi:hypothetical protein
MALTWRAPVTASRRVYWNDVSYVKLDKVVVNVVDP